MNKVEEIILKKLESDPRFASILNNKGLANLLTVEKTKNLQDEIQRLRGELTTMEKTKELVVYNKDNQTKFEVGLQHEKFEELVKLISLNIPVYIWGPTGSGKTTAVENAAKALNFPYYRKVVSSQSSEGTLFGFHNGTGYVEGIAYKPYKDGGVLLIDEIDNGNPNINVVIKMLSDGVYCNFPCGPVPRHKDFRLVANANTIGNGANRQYVGRSVQDAALLNIFAFIQWEYDLVFESNLCEMEYKKWEGKDFKEFINLVATVWSMRDAIDEVGIKHIISPRNLINASRMLAQSMPKEFILESTILRGLEKTQAEKIINDARKHFQNNKQKLQRKFKLLSEGKEPKDDDLKTTYEKVLEKKVEFDKKASLEDLKQIFIKNVNDPEEQF